MAKILVTNNGTHSPEKWAMITAEEIFDTNNSALTGDRLISAQKFQLSLAEALSVHHEKVQIDEQVKLQQDVNDIHAPFTANDYLDDVINDVITVSKGTQWEAHFAKPEVQDAVKQVVGNHFTSSQHIERLWHSDRNPTDAVAATYKTQFNKGL